MSVGVTASQKGLSLLGKGFFGSLCVGTFGLGCWQSQRYFEKIKLVEERQIQLALEPSHETSTLTDGNGFRKIELQGRFRHDLEVLVGPRAAPPGALPDKPGSSASGMSSGPQGYFVLAPFETKDNQTIMVNRGWVPRHFGANDHRNRRGSRPTTQQQKVSPNYLKWERPRDNVAVTVVRATPEEPKYLVAQHMLEQNPPILYWFDAKTLHSIMCSSKSEHESKPFVLATQVRDDSDKETDLEWPLSPPASRVGDFKTSPAVHLGYLVTWYGLSAAGVFMTRKLIRRGR